MQIAADGKVVPFDYELKEDDGADVPGLTT
jgi:hypothetical protein